MSKQTVLADIKAKIKPNGDQQITGQILQDVLVESVELAATEDELKAIQTEVSKKANSSDIPSKTSQLTNDSTYQTKANLDTALESYTKTSDVDKLKAEVTKNTQDIATKANTSDVPTKVSQLENDSKFATQEYVIAGLATKADKDSLASLESDITSIKAKNTDQDKSIQANQEAITGLTTSKQDKLVSGTNIKTINNQSILGEGNITIQGGGSSVTVDSELSTTSENPVQNKVITTKIDSVETELGNKANASDIPTKTSQLDNDSGFTTKGDVASTYATKESVDTEFASVNDDIAAIQTKNTDQDKLIKANSDSITGLTTKVTTNTTDIATLNQALATKADTSDLESYATKTSVTDLSSKVDNQAKLITANTEALKTKANTGDIPTKTSQLTNDSTYQTKASLDTALEGYATKESVTALTTEVSKKASQADLDTLNSTVTTQGQTITSIQTEIGDINTILTEING